MYTAAALCSVQRAITRIFGRSSLFAEDVRQTQDTLLRCTGRFMWWLDDVTRSNPVEAEHARNKSFRHGAVVTLCLYLTYFNPYVSDGAWQ